MMRYFQIAIVLFWLGSMGWLAKTALTPDEAGMVEVDPRRPVEVFFNWSDTTRMLLLQNGVKLGEVQLVSFSEDGPEDPAGFSVAVMLNGDVEPNVIGTFARCLFRFQNDFSLHSSDFLFRMPSNNFRVLASTKQGGDVTKAEASLAGNVIFSYDSEAGDEIDPGLLGMASGNDMIKGILAETGNPTDWKSQIKAFRGMHKFSGKRLPIYLLKLSIAEQSDYSLRIYLSESGEPLQIESDLGFIAISEMLSPVERFPLKREAEFRTEE